MNGTIRWLMLNMSTLPSSGASRAGRAGTGRPALRERAALDVVREQLLVPRPLGDVGDRSRQAEQVQPLRVLHHRDDQALAVGELDGEAEVDVVARDDLVTPDLAVDPGIVLQRLDRRARDEDEVGGVDAVVALVLGL